MHYLKKRMTELASPATRSFTDPLAEWATKRIRLDDRAFSFEDHEYLRAIYDDTAPHVVLCKAAQIGGTTWAILRSIHACLCGLNVIYFFPTRTDVLDFSRSRVGPLLAENPFLARQIAETNTMGLKRIGQAYLYLRGMQSSVGMKSVPADMAVFDELDEADPAAKSMARERLAHSDYKRMIELSNPSLPDYGIDEAYQATDRRHWTVKCTACGRWTALDTAFPQKLGEDVRIIRRRDDGSCYRACPKCAAELDLAAGEWVAEFPDRTSHGYRISQLFSSKVDPGEILREYETTRFPDRFYNLKIGIAWADTQNRVDRATVLACCGEEPIWQQAPQDVRCTMGVDVGKDLHVVVSKRVGRSAEPRQIVYLGVHQAFEELAELIQRFRVRRCVVDAMPEIHATRDFARAHHGRVWMCYFNEHQKGQPKWDRENRIVQVNRTEILDLSRRVIRDRHRVLPRRSRLVEEFARHVANNAKRLEEDEETGEQRYKYIRTGTDHFSLALTYDCLAATRDRSGETRFGKVDMGRVIPWRF